MFFKKTSNISRTRKDIYKEEWEDWSKEEWILHQPYDEQVRLKALSIAESDQEFALWCLKKGSELNKKLDKLREEGILPPLKGLPNYGNRPIILASENPCHK